MFSSQISIWIKDLNVRPDTIILLKNIGRILFHINRSKIFFDPSSRVMKIKTKINKWDLIKLKIFCTAKETINKMNRQPSEWQKIFATDKGLISKIIQTVHAAQYQRSNPIKERVEDLNRHFSKEDIRWPINT